MSHPDTVAGGPSSDLPNLQEIRDEIASLRQKFDEGLKNIRGTLTDNITEMTRLLNETKVVPDTRVNENAFPENILGSLYKNFLDATRQRRAFETSVANCERSRAQKDVFDILEHLDDSDADVVRVRALMDDAVNNIGNVPRPPPSTVKHQAASKTAGHIIRPSTSKQQCKPAAKRSTKLTQQQPSSSSPKIILSTVASKGEKPIGLADIVSFSTEELIASAPRISRPRVFLPSVPPQRTMSTPGKSNRLDRGEVVQFKRTRPQSEIQAKSEETKHRSLRFVPLGMRQYTMWPSEKSSKPGIISMENQPKEDDNLSAEDIKNMLETALNQHLDRRKSQFLVQDRGTGTCRQDFTQEEASSPILSPKKHLFADAKTSPKTAQNVSRAQSVQSIPRRRSSSLPTVTPELTPTSEGPQSTRLEVVQMSWLVLYFADGGGSPVGGDAQQLATIMVLGWQNPRPTRRIRSDKALFNKSVLFYQHTLRTHRLSVHAATESTNVISSQARSSSRDISTSDSEIKTINPLMVSNNRTQSPIRSVSAEVSGVDDAEVGSSRSDGFSLTEPRSFSDGVWLDPDRSEGEYDKVAIRGFEEVASLNKKLGPLPSPNETDSMVSPSEEEKRCSEGEFTLDQVNNQSGAWVAPWRDPLLHLIALDTVGGSSKLPWTQQHTVEKVAAVLDTHHHCTEFMSEPDEVECSSIEDLSWVKRIAAARRARKQLESQAQKNVDKSEGEISLPTSVKELRRAVLTRSSQRMRQIEASFSDDEDTLREEESPVAHGSPDLCSVVKSLSDKENDEISTPEVSVSNQEESLQSV
ncbi:hypothetical protein Aperf_G00000000743 [Anoplocephala perfoliata]